ncbi:hypothetical protein MNV49_001250 [Pseudohyphozyma bogoriensis]|nr:hypothetical protein MNV49_001250 [Pseudohyphozyma bogoriensis]
MNAFRQEAYPTLTAFDLQTSPPRLHLSTSRQVPRTLAAIFPDETELWLLAIPRIPRLDAMLEWEGDEGCAHVVLKDDQDGLDVWGEVATSRPTKKEADGWDTGELQW